MPVAKIELSTPVLAYQAIRRKLVSLRRRRQTAGDETSTGRQSKRRREFAPPEVIKRLNGDDSIHKVAVVASVQVGENGIAVLLMPLHGKASESLTSLLETFHTAHATTKPVVDGPLTSVTANVTPHADGVAVGSGPTTVPPLQETETVPSSYSSNNSSTTVEASEHDPDRSDVFGQISFDTTYRPKERVTSVSSEMSRVSNTTVIWVGSLTPAPGQAGPSRIGVQARRPPSEITVDWQDAIEDEEEEIAEENASLLSISPGSPKTMHVKTPGQSGMPSPNVEIYSTTDTSRVTHMNQFHPAQIPVERTMLEPAPDAAEGQEKQATSEQGEKQERPVVPFFYGSKTPVLTGNLSTAAGKNTYGGLIARQRRTLGGTNSRPSTPKPHSCSATPLVAPKPCGLKRSLTVPARTLTRKDTFAGHFPGTPPKSIGCTTSTSGGSLRPRSSSASSGSPRPRSSSKIPIPVPNPTTPTAIAEGRKLNDTLGVSFLGDIAEADCESGVMWERHRDDVMGPLGGTPTTRLGGFVRPVRTAAMPMGISRAATMPMGSLVGTAMTSNDVMRS